MTIPINKSVDGILIDTIELYMSKKLSTMHLYLTYTECRNATSCKFNMGWERHSVSIHIIIICMLKFTEGRKKRKIVASLS